MEKGVNTSRGSGAFVGAAILIVIGVAALIGNLGGGQYVGESLALAIGVAFLVAYVMTRQYGYLVAGGILSGVGAGVLIGSALNASDSGSFATIGGGLGFLLIYAVDVVAGRVSSRWWPVVPGALMLVAGTSTVNDSAGLARQFEIWSPVLLIALGVLILISRGRRANR